MTASPNEIVAWEYRLKYCKSRSELRFRTYHHPIYTPRQGSIPNHWFRNQIIRPVWKLFDLRKQMADFYKVKMTLNDGSNGIDTLPSRFRCHSIFCIVL